MNRTLTARRALLVSCAALAAAATLAGCAKKMTSVDPSYTQIEGVENRNARIVTWTNQPLDTLIFESVTDTVTGATNVVFRGHITTVTGPPGIEAQIFDSTAASRYQVFRRTPNGGYAQLFDFSLAASLRWPDTEWEMYEFTDQPIGLDPLLAYVGRGLVGGFAGVSSPLTNVGLAPNAVIPQTIAFAAPRVQPDSTMTLAWSADPAAAGYWVEAMPQTQFVARGVSAEHANDGLPVISQAGGFANLRAFFGADGSATFLTRTVFRRNLPYLVRIDAVDANGRVINRLRGDYQVKKPNAGGPFFVIPLGGVVIQASKPVPGLPYGWENDDFQTWDAVPHFGASAYGNPASARPAAASTALDPAAVRIGGNFMQIRVRVL